MPAGEYDECMSHRVTLCIIAGIAISLNILVWFFVLEGEQKFTVSFLDVGQGDSILIQTPSEVDVLIDAGKDRSAVRRLSEELGALDRTIDMVIATHPDADHIGGLPAVFSQYQVRSFVSSGAASDSNPSLALEGSLLQEDQLVRISAERGQRIYLEENAYLDVLFPDRLASGLETNAGSVVVRLVYGETSFLLTGDAPDEIENWLVSLNGEGLKSTVLKAGHHGSRTSTSEIFITAVDPDIVVVSAGKDNSYGHPHAEVVERILASGARLFSTAQYGTIRLESDGKSVRVR